MYMLLFIMKNILVNNFVYKADVKIELENEIIKRRIVAKRNNNLITIDNELIPISSIKDIY